MVHIYIYISLYVHIGVLLVVVGQFVNQLYLRQLHVPPVKPLKGRSGVFSSQTSNNEQTDGGLVGHLRGRHEGPSQSLLKNGMGSRAIGMGWARMGCSTSLGSKLSQEAQRIEGAHLMDRLANRMNESTVLKIAPDSFNADG